MEPQPRYLSEEELEELRTGLTMLDVYRARKSPDSANRGLMAYWEAAKRLELVEANVSLETFLGRIRAEDFNRIMAGTGTVPNVEEVSPSPASGGETERTSSDGTDTDQETS